MTAVSMKNRLFLLSFFLIFGPFAFSQSFEFALIGDMPYNPKDSSKFTRLIQDINETENLEWVLHTGDVKSGGSPCSDDFLRARFQLYQQFTLPFIITPGDNEWTDCHRPLCGGYDPLERLSFFRKLFYANPLESLGQERIPLESQSQQSQYALYPENQRWEKGDVMFLTLHIVGSLNGMAPFEGRSEEDDKEATQRMQASIDWLRQSFQLAEEQQRKGLFLMIHANPGFDRIQDSAMQVGFGAFLNALEELVVQFKEPVLLAHGDSHYFRYDKPLVHSTSRRRIENFTRVEAFGDRDIHWLKVTVNPDDPNLFSIRQEIIEENLEEHEK